MPEPASRTDGNATFHGAKATRDVAGEVSTLVSAPPAAVYSYLADFTRHPEWSRNLSKVARVTDGPVGVGTIFRTSEGPPPLPTLGKLKMMFFFMVGLALGAKPYSEAEIMALEPNRRIAWRARLPRRVGDFNRASWEFSLAEEGTGTRVIQRFRYSPQAWAARRMVGSAAAIEAACAVNLAELKARLERGR